MYDTQPLQRLDTMRLRIEAPGKNSLTGNSTARGYMGFLIAAALGLTLFSPARAEVAAEQEMRDIAQEAYIYFYPLVTMDVTRKQLINMPADSGFGVAPNQFDNIRSFPTAEMREVVRPNFDTLYSSAWLDLSQGPVIVTVPNTEGRYFLLPMLDMWSDVFAVPGKRTTGTTGGNYAVVPPGWSGSLPAGVERIAAPTSSVWIIGRT